MTEAMPEAMPGALTEALRAFIGGDADGDFDELALDLYRWQRAHNAQYDAICGDNPAPSCWQQIPTVPVGLFRDLALTSFPVQRSRVVFRTSGTTSGRRGQHRALDTLLYDLGAARHARRCLGQLPPTGVALVSFAEDSSLGHMCRTFVPDMPTFFDAERGLDSQGAWAALRAASQPVFVPGTAFAFDLLLGSARDRVARPVALLQGSVLMVTGGSKGRSVTRSEAALNDALQRFFPGTRIVGEYGMTELSSQLWATPWGAPYIPPAWLRVKAVDPATGAPLPAGQVGLLSFVDLANRWSVLAIETQDLGTVDADGAVILHGRLPGAPARGCSLTVEEAMARVARAGR